MTASEFDAAVNQIRRAGIAPKPCSRRKQDCTPEQWAANREYMVMWHRNPENKKKHDRSRARLACGAAKRISPDQRMPAVDRALLMALAIAVDIGSPATASDLLDVASDEVSGIADRWSPRAVASLLGRYGIKSRKTNGRKVYDRMPDDVRQAIR